MTEAAARSGRRQRSLHCKPAEQAMIRERAEAAGKTVSRYVMELALADDPDRHPRACTGFQRGSGPDPLALADVWSWVPLGDLARSSPRGFVSW